MIIRNPQFLALLLLIPVFIAGWFFRRGRIPGLALALRVIILALVILAMADPLIAARSSRPQPLLVLVVDQSDSLGEVGQAEMRTRAQELAQAHNGKTQLLYFGANIVAETGSSPQAAQSNSTDPLAFLPNPELQPENTDIAGALRMARGLVEAGGGRVVLISDGVQTRGDALTVAAGFGTAGIPIDTLVYNVPERPEIWIASVEAPPTLREGEEFEVQVEIGSTVATTVQLGLFVGAEQTAAQEVNLTPGKNYFRYANQAGQPGVLSLLVSINGQPDTFERNNHGAATSLVAPSPRVLLVEGQPAAARPLREAIQQLNIIADVVPPTDLPAQISALDPYEGVVLLDVPAGELSLDQMAALREFVRSEGRGLIATGGRTSFTLGSYKDTPLEEALPVSMSPPQRSERPDVTLLLIIDQSASMGPDSGDSKFNMAKEAAILATESLRENDRIGVLAFDIAQNWLVEFQQVGDNAHLASIHEQITRLPLGGGTDILGALQTGLPVLQEQPGQVRHVVLLTDGRSFTTNRPVYRDMVERARAQDITLSSIAIGSDADTELLRELAQYGGGRYHFANSPEDIPRLTLLESEILRTEPQVEGDFRAELVTPHPALRNFAPNEIPGLQGYVATTIKPESELILQSPENDPVLAAWQYGLGRAVAWTPSIEAPWAQNWSNWPEYGQFWAQIIRYTLREPDSGPLQVRVTPRGDAVTLSADAVAPNGEPLDLADMDATITLPDGTTRTLPLRQTAPGHYAQDVTLPGDGPYALTVYARKDGDERLADAGYVQRYPNEYLPQSNESGSISGTALLEQISALSGGTVLGATDRPGLAAEVAAEGNAQGLWPWFLLAAALLWPVEIAVRRGWIRIG